MGQQPSNQPEAVITGMGLVTPLGNDCRENFRRLRKGETAIADTVYQDRPSSLPPATRVENFQLPPCDDPRLRSQMKFLNRGSLLGLAAACEAMAQAGLQTSNTPDHRKALYIGSGDSTMVGYEFLYPATCKALDNDTGEIDPSILNATALREAPPFFLLESMHNNLFSFVSAFFQLKGPNTTLASFSPCGAQALECACRAIRLGLADMALVIGCTTWTTDIILHEMREMGMLAQGDGKGSSFRPLDQRAKGFVPGEGGAAVVVEDPGKARARGARILGAVEGTAHCTEAFDGKEDFPPAITFRSMALALKEAKIDLHELSFINLHGIGSLRQDRSELQSVQELSKNGNSRIPLCALKPYTGHLGAASDLGEIVLGLMSLGEGFIPATPRFRTSEDAFRGLAIADEHRPARGNRFLSAAYGWGGQSVCVVARGESHAGAPEKRRVKKRGREETR